MSYNTPPTATAGFPLAASDFNSGVRDSIITLANPARASVRRTAVQSILNNAVTALIWQAEDYDSGLWVPGSPTVFGPIPADLNGAYFRIGVCAQFAINAAGGRHFSINRNGAIIASWNGFGSASWYSGASFGTEFYGFTGDTFSVSAYQNSGAALNVDTVYPVRFWISQFVHVDT